MGNTKTEMAYLVNSKEAPSMCFDIPVPDPMLSVDSMKNNIGWNVIFSQIGVKTFHRYLSSLKIVFRGKFTRNL